MKTVLTIAGSDPSGGAGIQADLRVFEHLKIKGLSAITAITAQTPEEFISVYPTPADILTQQLSAASKGVEIDSIKIGMIATTANVQAIIWFLKTHKNIPVVIDPVFDSSTGFPLLEPAALPILKQRLLPLATVVTPNLSEAATLAGMQVADIETMRKAASVIHEDIRKLRGGGHDPLSIIVTGGHLEKRATDILYDGKDYTEIDGEHLNASMHGSGCVYSSALAGYLAMGEEVVSAAKKAKDFVTKSLKLQT